VLQQAIRTLSWTIPVDVLPILSFFVSLDQRAHFHISNMQNLALLTISNPIFHLTEHRPQLLYFSLQFAIRVSYAVLDRLFFIQLKAYLF